MPRVTIDGHDNFDLPDEQTPEGVRLRAKTTGQVATPAGGKADQAEELLRILKNPASTVRPKKSQTIELVGPSPFGPLLAIAAVVLLLTAAVAAMHAYQGKTLLARLEPSRLPPKTIETLNPYLQNAAARRDLAQAAEPVSQSAANAQAPRTMEVPREAPRVSGDAIASAPPPSYAEVQSNLRRRLFNAGFTGVDAEVTEGRALLTGLVSKPAQLVAAEGVALATPGIESVRNEIETSRPLPSVESSREALVAYPSYPHPYVRSEAPAPEEPRRGIYNSAGFGEPVNALARTGALVALSALAELASRKGWGRLNGNRALPYGASPQAAPLPYGAIHYGNPWRR